MSSSMAKNLVINLNNSNNNNSNLNMEFDLPVKNKNNIYEAKLKTSLTFKLPRLEIEATGKNEDGNYEIWYNLDLEKKKNENLILYLESLDKNAIDLAIDNSITWFKKKINSNILRDSYQPFYGEEGGRIVLKLEIQDKKLLQKFSEKHITFCTIEGLKFYANKFMYSVIVSDITEINDEPENIDFIKYLDKKDPLNKVLELEKSKEESKIVDNELIDEFNYIVSKDKDDMNLNKNIEISTINTEKLNSNKNIETETRNIDEENKEKELKNLETVILQTRKEARQYFVNAEKASITASNLRKEAIKKAGELKKIENEFDELSQNSKIFNN